MILWNRVPYVVFSVSWHRIPKILRICKVIKYLFYANELTDGWEPLESFRMGASHPKNQGSIGKLGLSAPILQPLGRGELMASG